MVYKRSWSAPIAMELPDIFAGSNRLVRNQVKRSFMANALFHAVQTCRFRRVQVLFANGLKPNIKNDNGLNLLMAALSIEDNDKREKMFGYLVKKGVDPHYVERATKRDVFSWVVCAGKFHQVRQLLDLTGGDLNLLHKDKDGYTALHHACIGDNIDIVKIIVTAMKRYQLTVDIYDNEGITPFLHAKRHGYFDISNVLLHDGQASPRQGDKHTFRGPEAWAQVGENERKKKEKKDMAQDMVTRKISGRLVQPDKHCIPRIGLTNENNVNGHFRSEQSLAVARKLSRDCDDTDALDMSSRFNRNIEGSTTSNSRPITLIASGGRFLGSQSLDTALSLLEVAGTDHNRLNMNFVDSEFDMKKKAEYASMTTLMDTLSAQQTSAFRMTAVAPVRRKSRPITAGKEPAPKDKVSTLAILLGKDKKKPRSIRGQTRANHPKKTKKGQDVKKKSRVVLPPIRRT